jgi:hypothetical protein
VTCLAFSSLQSSAKRRRLCCVVGRPLQIEFPGTACQVMPRGSQCQPIFKDDLIRKRFLETPALKGS